MANISIFIPSRLTKYLKKISVPTLAILFVALSSSSMFVSATMQTLSNYNTRQLEATTSAANLTRSLAQHAEDTFILADSALIGIGDRLDVYGSSAKSIAQIDALIEKQLAASHQFKGIFVFDANGNYMTRTKFEHDKIPHIRDRSYFDFHRNNANMMTHVGAPIRSHSSNEWVIPVSRRTNNAEGNFSGLILITISIDYFQRFYEQFDIGKKGSIALLLDHGFILVRRPFKEIYIGKNVSTSPLFQIMIKERESGTLTYTSKQDDIERIYGISRVKNYPLMIAAGLSTDEVFSEWKSDAIIRFLCVGALVVLFVVIGKRLLHLIKKDDYNEKVILQTRDELQVLNEELQKQVMQDGLTGLGNRRRFDEALPHEFARAMRGSNSLALIMIDVDYFKNYNDTYGHPAGDDCLKIIAEVLKANQNRPGDLAIRYGGEEMCILLPQTDVIGAMIVAEKIRRAIAHLKMPHLGNPEGVVTISAGVNAFVPARSGHNPLQLLETTDKALYLAKSSGRNRVATGQVIEPVK